MKNDKYLKKILITLGLIVLVVGFVFLFVFINIKNKNEHISNLKNELSSGIVKGQYMLSMNKTVKDAGSDIARIDNLIISSDGDVSFIENLESIARSDGLTVEIQSLVFEDSPLASSSGMTTFKIKANIKGSWSDTYKFLAQIESSPFKIKINNFAFISGVDEVIFDPNKSARSDNMWQSKFEISVLKYK